MISKYRPLFIPLLVTFFLHTSLPIIYPSIRLTTFAPLLCYTFINFSFLPSLWVSFICGLLCDMVSFSYPFGSFACIYVFCALLLHRHRSHFFNDKKYAFVVYCLIFSVIHSISETLLFSFVYGAISFSFLSLSVHFLIMPIFDSLYSFIWFSSPKEVKKRVKQLHLLIKEFTMRRKAKKNT